MICSATVCLWHTVAAMLSSRVSEHLLEQLDLYVAISIATLFLLFHGLFIALIYLVVSVN